MRGFLDRQTNHTYAAKETVYGGVTFRSRLEARWAIVFDTLEIKWEYEPRYFRTEEGGYLPDFLIHSKRRFWVEVKGPEPIARDYVRAAAVGRQTNQKFRFFVGPIPNPPSHGVLRTRVLSGAKWRPADWETPWGGTRLDNALRASLAYSFEGIL